MRRPRTATSLQAGDRSQASRWKLVPCFLLAAAGLAAAPTLAQLTTAFGELLREGAGSAGTADRDDFFGSALAVGDFDGNGIDDLAVGVPGEDGGQGAVHLFYGAREGFVPAREATFPVPPGHPGPQFGAELAAVDLDCDGFDDLAIGHPYAMFAGLTAAGRAYVLFGGAQGVDDSDVLELTAANWTSGGSPGALDRLGNSLVAVQTGSGSAAVKQLFVGVPGRRNVAGTAQQAGAIFSVRSDCLTQSLTFEDRIDQDTAGVSGVSEADDAFGSELGAGDFDQDGQTDLVVGVAFEDLTVGSTDVVNAGLIHVFAANGGVWSGADETSFTQEAENIAGDAESDDFFGRELASGDFDDDGFADLVVGVSETVGGNDAAGAVHVLRGSASGLVVAGSQLWSQDSGLLGTAEPFDSFGVAAVSGDFDGDHVSDLAVGVPGEDVGSIADAGAVNVIYGLADFGLQLAGNQLLDQQAILDEAPETGDRLGTALASGDFNADGRADLAIGVPTEGIGTQANAGVVHVLWGSDDGTLAVLSFSHGVVGTIESESTQFMTVLRSGALNLPVSVEHRLAAGTTATPGRDFLYTPGTLSWAAGDSSPRQFNVTLLEDNLDEGVEEVLFELASPSQAVAIGGTNLSGRRILDDSNDTVFFYDGFESGSTGEWSRRTP